MVFKRGAIHAVKGKSVSYDASISLNLAVDVEPT